MNQPASPSQPTPASAPGTVNLRINPKALVCGVIAVVSVLAFGFRVGSNFAADASDAPPLQQVEQDAPSSLALDLPPIDPTAGPEIAPTPTTLAETPVELDPVVTTVAETVPPTPQEDSSGGLATGASVSVQLIDGSVVSLGLPTGWQATESGNAFSQGPPKMNAYFLNIKSDFDAAVTKYAKYLEKFNKDVVIGELMNMSPPSNFVAVGMFEYRGTDVSSGPTVRDVWGFVIIATTTSGSSFVIDWWSDANVSDDVASANLEYFYNTYFG